VQCFIFIPSLECPLPVLGRGWGYDKVWPYYQAKGMVLIG